MKVPITRHEDASTLGGPASSRISTPTRRRARWGPRSWRPADAGSARSVLPAPESEALGVNASVAPVTRLGSALPSAPRHVAPDSTTVSTPRQREARVRTMIAAMRCHRSAAVGLFTVCVASVLLAQVPGSVAHPGPVDLEPPTTGGLGRQWRSQCGY